MPLAPLVAPLLDGRSLEPEEAAALARYLFDEATDGEVGAALALMAGRTPTGVELAGFAREMRSRAHRIETGLPGLVDTCGTGGGVPSFNLSTAAALLAAGAGATVAKHGNRAVTSLCGSADVLEELGVRLSSDTDELARRLREHGVAFLFAPNHHPATARVGPVRRALGFRTIFNALGPLLNPAGARRGVLGVYEARLVRPVAEALAELGGEAAYIVHGAEGLDEVSPCGPTGWARVDANGVTEGHWTPEDFGIEPLSPKALAPGEDRMAAAAIVREAIT
ncbi:anthranilate phosphoribosyltransferase, partial [bacterium]